MFSKEKLSFEELTYVHLENSHLIETMARYRSTCLCVKYLFVNVTTTGSYTIDTKFMITDNLNKSFKHTSMHITIKTPN